MSRAITEFVEAIAEKLSTRFADVAFTLYGHSPNDLDTRLVDNTCFDLTSKPDPEKVKRNYCLAEEIKLAIDGPEEEKPVG